MKNKLKLMIIFLIVTIMSSFITVNAQSTTVTATGSDVDSGKEITITLTSSVSLAGYTVSVTDLGGCTFKSVSAPTGVNGIPNGSTMGGTTITGTTALATYKFTAPSVTSDKNCTIKFKISGILSVDDEELDDTSSVSTIKVIAPKIDEKPSTGTKNQTPTTPTTPPATVTKSSEARLKNFGIKPNDFTGFKRDKYEYTTEVPNDVGEVEIYAEKLDAKATVEGAGKVQLKEGNNTFEVKVTAEDGTTIKTYKLTIKRRTAAEEEAANGEARLKSLGIKPEKYDFEGFDKDKTEYSVQIPENINEIEVYATAVDSKAQITGTGIITLEEGESTLEIAVIAVNGTKKTYSINVIRTEAEENEEPEQPVEEKFGLSKLSITGVTLNPKFDVETYEYKVDLKEDLTSLQIIAEANDEDATVEIVGNENLQDGENVITILVKNDKIEEVATYQIIVNKAVVAEEIQMSWLKPSTWGKEEIIKIILVIVLIILIICAIALKINISKEGKKAKKVDLPGADELDKAIAEHQELAEEEANSEEIVEKDEAKANYLEEIAKSRLNEENVSNFEVEEYDIKPRRKGKHF